MTSFREKPLTSADKVLLLRQLGLLAAGGLSPLDALQRLARSNESKKLQVFCRTVLDRHVERKMSDDDTLRSIHPLIPVLNEQVPDRQGFSQALYDMADVSETTSGFKSAILAAMVYPVKLFLLALAIWSLVLIFVIPVFDAVFIDFGAALPYPTQVVVAASRFLQKHILLVGGLLLALVLLIVVERRTQRVFLWFFPSLRSLAKKTTAIHFTHLLSVCLAAGLSLDLAVNKAAGAMPATSLSSRLRNLNHKISTPAELTDALRNTRLFPSTLLGLIGLAGQATHLTEILRQSAKYLCKGFDAHLAKAVKTVEMAVFLMVALVVGGMVIAMYLPIFRLAGAVGG